MEIIGPIIISTIAGLSTVIGGLIIFLKIKNKNKFISFCLSLSTSVMIMISILDLLPNSSYIIINKYGFNGVFLAVVAFILGIIIVNFSNKLLNKYSTSKNNLYKVGVLSMIALIIHNFPEGIATFMTSYKNISLGISLGIAIMLHNIPEGIAIAVPIYYATKNKKNALKSTFLSGISEPLGAIFAYIILYKYINDVLISLILIFVSGIMITIAINELFPQSLSYKKPKYVIYGLIIGVILTIINHLLF